MVHLKNPVSIEILWLCLRKVLVAFNELPKTKINYPAANSGVLKWE